MKPLFFLIALVACINATAQTSTIFCTQVNCPISITAPQDSSMIFGTATIVGVKDSVVAWKWSQVSGPSIAVMVTPNAPQTVLRKLVPGVYVFSLTASSKLGSVQTQGGSQVSIAAAPTPPPTPRNFLITYTLVGNQWVPTLTLQ